jgi:two-component system chemotaxis response regulator CheB
MELRGTRVLVVDDSPVLRILVRAILEDEGAIVTEADSGEQALALLETHAPDIVTMDLHMPGLDGCATTAKVLERHALPVVILTASAAPGSPAVGRALEAGALTVLQKPGGPGTANFAACAQKLVRTLHLMAQVKVVRRRPARNNQQPAFRDERATGDLAALPRVVAIGASAGGPSALKLVLRGMAPHAPWAVVVAQHIAAGFIDSYCHWLTAICSLSVEIASHGQPLRPNSLYLAPEGWNVGVTAEGRLSLETCQRGHLFCPSVDYLFSSIARSLGQHAIGIQLSGMGRDGAAGLAELRRAGALTLAQEPASAVIDSMPRAAIELGAASDVLPPEHIAALLNTIALRMPRPPLPRNDAP